MDSIIKVLEQPTIYHRMPHSDRHKQNNTTTRAPLWISAMLKINTTFSLFPILQLNASSQNSVSNGEEATLVAERSSKNSLRPGMTDFWMPNPMAPAQKLNFSMSWLVTQASLPIHWRGGEGLSDSSSSRSFNSAEAVNATITTAVDLQGHYSRPIQVSRKNRREATFWSWLKCIALFISVSNFDYA